MANENRADEFIQLFAQYEGRLRAFATSLVIRSADTDDVLQQAYLTLWKRFDQFETGTNFMAWAGRVIYLHVLRHRRQQAREEVLLDPSFLDAVARVSVEDPFVAELGGRERALQECVGQLRPEHLAMLRARYEDLSTTEQMAEIFNRSGQAIYNALFRIRRKLFDCINEKVAARARYE
jgi:RNA polymerase sigma-70 factor (ECF subfamily)